MAVPPLPSPAVLLQAQQVFWSIPKEKIGFHWRLNMSKAVLGSTVSIILEKYKCASITSKQQVTYATNYKGCFLARLKHLSSPEIDGRDSRICLWGAGFPKQIFGLQERFAELFHHCSEPNELALSNQTNHVERGCNEPMV